MKKIYQSIIKYPVSTVLNMLSMVIAFSGIITLVLYVNYENSFDKHNTNFERIYKLQIGKDDGTLPAVLTPILKENISDISAISPTWDRRYWMSTEKNADKDQTYNLSCMFATNDFLDIFSFDYVFGTKKDALTNNQTIVLTQSYAQKLFGNINPVGKKVFLENRYFTCTAVIKDLPKTSSFNTDCFLSFETLWQFDNSFAKDWSEWSFHIFLKLNNNNDRADVLAQINNIDRIKQVYSDVGIKEQEGLYLQPLKELHFSDTGYFKTVNKTVLDILILLAIILAIMGIVNFVNLLTSQAMQRAKSFAVRRVLGGSRRSSIIQIVTESVVVSLFSLIIALVLHRLLFPYFENILQINGLSFDGREIWYLYFATFAFVYGVVASIYPAWFITSAKVSQALKGLFLFSGKGKLTRNILLVLQFSFTIMLIIGSIAIEKQINYWHNFDTGFKNENVVYLQTNENIINHKQAFTKELLAHSNIIEYTYSQHIPGHVGMTWGRVVDEQYISITCWPIDEHFLDFFDIKIVEGRKFSNNIGVDKNKFILNQSAVKVFGWDNPLEKKINGFSFEGSIVGVAKDVNFSSLKETVQPMQFWLTDERQNVLMLKISNGNITETIQHIKNVWSKFEPDLNVDVEFLDDSMNKLYKKEEGIAYFIEFASLWSILLSLTGLLGLAIFIARQRTKEIGIRRTNGASISEIILMLNYDFIKWILIAFVIASPISYYAISKWLENFAYKTPILWWIFILAGVLTIVLSVLAVSIQTFRVARKNPVKALRYE